MRSRKGFEDLIGVTFLFYISLGVMLVLYLLTSGHHNHVEKEVNRQIDYQIGDIRKRSTITTTMDDRLSRAAVSRDYQDKTAREVISYYFSTPGDNIYIAGEAIPRSQVRQDLKTYLEYKMTKYWDSGPNKVDYYLNISQKDPGDRPREIVVKKSGYHPEADWSLVSYPVKLSNGESAEVKLWTKTSRGIYGVSTG